MQKSSITDGLGLTVDLLDYGARICDINFNGSQLALGYDTAAHYRNDPYYLGATIGPITNRIANGQLTVGGELLQMPQNEGPNTLHSGGSGFDKQTWQLESNSPNQVCYRLDYDMTLSGLKGQVTTWAIYRVTEGRLVVKYRSYSDTDCYINLTNHVYLNLDGLGTQRSADITRHQFEVRADSYIEVDEHSLPTGEIKPIAKPFLYTIDNSPYQDFEGLCDHHFNIGDPNLNTVNSMLVARSLTSGIQLEVSSDSPGFQFYTGKYLSEPFTSSGGFCVETQLAPNAINQANFYSPLLNAGEHREQTTHFEFKYTRQST